MSKAEQLIEYLIQDVVAFIVEDLELPVEEAMRRFYSSHVFDLLQDESTGLYLSGAAYLYQLYLEEQHKLPLS